MYGASSTAMVIRSHANGNKKAPLRSNAARARWQGSLRAWLGITLIVSSVRSVNPVGTASAFQISESSDALWTRRVSARWKYLRHTSERKETLGPSLQQSPEQSHSHQHAKPRLVSPRRFGEPNRYWRIAHTSIRPWSAPKSNIQRATGPAGLGCREETMRNNASAISTRHRSLPSGLQWR